MAERVTLKDVQQKTTELENQLGLFGERLDRIEEKFRRIDCMEDDMRSIRDMLESMVKNNTRDRGGETDDNLLGDGEGIRSNRRVNQDDDVQSSKKGERPDNREAPYSRINFESMKVIFPTFDGSNFRTWRNKCVQYFYLEETPEPQRLKLILMCMEGRAFSWQKYYLQENDRNGIHWKQLLYDMAARFDTCLFEDPLAELINLKQVGSVEEYLEAFDELVTKASVDGSVALSCFLGGLQGPLETAVRIQKPRNLIEAMKMTKLQEEFLLQLHEQPYSKTNFRTNNIRNTTYQPNYTKNSTTYFNQNSYSASQPNQNTPNHTFTSSQQNQHSQASNTNTKLNLSQTSKNQQTHIKEPDRATKDDRRAKGLCVMCGDKWMPGHRANCRVAARLRYMLLEIAEGELGDEEDIESKQSVEQHAEDKMNNSLNALQGLSGGHHNTISVPWGQGTSWRGKDCNAVTCREETVAFK